MARWLIGHVVLLAVTVGAQTPTRGSWETFTNLTMVNGVAAGQSGNISVATGGGLFVLNPSAGVVETATNAEGLTSNDLTAIAYDSHGGLWVGAGDGSLDHRDSDGAPWRTLTDIRNSNRLQKRIQRIASRGDTLFVISQFGVSVYRIDRNEFADTYGSFGYVTQPICWDVAIARDTVWVASDQGIAAAPVSSPNLSSPTSWIRLGTADGLPSLSVRTLLAVGDTLLVGTTAGTVARINGEFVPQPSLASGQTLRLLAAGGAIAVLTNEFGESRVSMLGSVMALRSIVGPPVTGAASDIALGPVSGEVWMGFPGLGVGTLVSGTWAWQAPNGPGTNLFTNVAVDAEGIVWAGTGFDGGGRGFMRFNRAEVEGARWKTFSTTTTPGILFNDYYKVSPVPGGAVWVSSWGKGVVQVTADSVHRRIDKFSTPSLSGSILSDSAYVVVGGVAADPQGLLWFVNRTATDRNYLARLDDDSTFTKYRHESLSGVFTSMVIDRNGTKWLANSEPTSKTPSGLAYFDESGQVAGVPSTGGWGTFMESEGLSDNTVMALAVDLDGDVWVGTDLGVTIFNEPSNPRIRRTSSFPVREQSIQSIAVDGVNNKWVGTKEGVFVVSPDGSLLISQYTVSNTGGKLVSNDIRSIAIDQVRGIVYLGSEQGLSALAIDAVQAERRYNSLVVGPNPFPVPSQEPLTIRSLIPQTRIKILEVTGSVVTEFDAQGGGRAFWDGRDRFGRYVGSGTYFIVAFNENGEQLTTSKVAVVRR